MSFQANESFFSPASGLGYYSACSSDNFEKIYLSHNTGIYISHDYGNTWIQTVSITAVWSDICCSTDGKYVYAVRQNNNIYRSENYGATFTQVVDGTRNWYGCCCSTDGQYVYGCVNGGAVWLSRNYGTSFGGLFNPLGINAPSSVAWRQLCCSNDGYLLAASATLAGATNSYEGRIWLLDATNLITTGNSSNNSNTNWTVLAGFNAGAKDLATNSVFTGNKNWVGLRCNTTRTKIISTISLNSASATDRGVYIFTNDGTNWTYTQALNQTTADNTTTPSPSHNGGAYVIVGCSRDFKNIITGDYNTTNNRNCFYSTDSGLTWTAVNLGIRTWNAAYVCNNKFIIGADDANNLYIGQFYQEESLFKINGISPSQIVAPCISYGENTGSVEYLNNSNISYPWYASTFQNTSSTVNIDSTGIATLGFSIGGAGQDGIVEYETNNFVTKNFNNQTNTDSSNYFLRINNNSSYNGIANTNSQAYIQTDSLKYFKSFTISFWIYPKNIAITNEYISLINITNGSTSSTGCIDIAIDGNSQKVILTLNNGFATGTGHKLTNDLVLTTDFWYHITATYNATTGVNKLYVGAKNYTTSITANNNTSSSYIGTQFVTKDRTDFGTVINTYSILLIGIRYGANVEGTAGGSGPTSRGYNGHLANFNMFPNELSAEQVKYLFDNPNANLVTNNSLVPSYNLNFKNTKINLEAPLYSFVFNTTNTSAGAYSPSSSIGTNKELQLVLGTNVTSTDLSYVYNNTNSSIKFNNDINNQILRKFLFFNNGAAYTNINGKSNQAYLIRNTNIQYLESFSISFWIYHYLPTSNTTAEGYYGGYYSTLLNFTNGTTVNNCIDISIDGTINNIKKVVLTLNTLNLSSSNTNKAIANVNLSANKWYHIVATHNHLSGLSKIYVNYNDSTDGTPNKVSVVGTKQYANNTSPSSYSSLTVGLRRLYEDSTSRFTLGYWGLMSNLNIYSGVLNDNDINVLYNAGLDATGTTANLSSYNYIYNNNNFPLITGQSAFGSSPLTKLDISKYYKIKNSPSIQYFAPFYTVYSSIAGYTTNTDHTHTLQSWTKYAFVMCIGGGGGGGGGNFLNGGEFGGSGGGGAGGGMGYILLDLVNYPTNDNKLVVRIGSGGAKGETTGPNWTDTYFVGGNGSNGNQSYVKGLMTPQDNTTYSTLCIAYGGAKAFNKYNNTYGRTQNNTDADVGVITKNDTGTTWHSSYLYYIADTSSDIKVKGTPKNDNTATSVSRGATRGGWKSQYGGNGGINGTKYTGITYTDGSITYNSNNTYSLDDDYVVVASGGNGVFRGDARVLQNYAAFSCYKQQIGNNGANGKQDTGSGSRASSNLEGGNGGNSGLYNSTGNLILNDLNNNSIILAGANPKFMYSQNGTLIYDYNSFISIGKGGRGGNGEGSTQNGQDAESNRPLPGNDGAVFIFEYAFNPFT